MKRRDNYSDFRSRTIEEPETGPHDERPTNMVSPALVEHLEDKFPNQVPNLPIGAPSYEVSSTIRVMQGRQEVINYLRNLLKKG